ncbi:chaperonin 10-like protein [Boletus reticuloceps]|uniref:Chaperonin 10-like protein n=1 Tax=Boletus reticuloceps TaxID=495285 RepID=A0A8I2YIM3_9AGAM|nr:chaperonin 10-like protein [Boletus reticuloceps]
MTTQKALWLPKIGAQFTLGRNAIPEPGPGEALVKLKASALNHMDVHIQKSGFFEIKEYPVILGEEGAGVVLKVGDGVRNLARGDNVFVPSSLNLSHAEACGMRIPPNLSYEEAASILIAFAPFAVATYAQRPQGIALTPPFEEGGRGKYAGRPIVIFGGAASVGQQAIQLAKLSGFSPIITTASLHNEDLLLSLGATHVLDRKLPNAALIKRVRELVVAPLGYIFDAVSIKDTQQGGYALLAPGGTLAVVGPPQVGREDDGSGKKVIMVLGSFHLPPNRALGAKFAIALTRWLKEGKIKSNRIEVVAGGLNGVVPGLRQLAGGVSATKLVVCPPETIDV